MMNVGGVARAVWIIVWTREVRIDRNVASRDSHERDRRRCSNGRPGEMAAG